MHVKRVIAGREAILGFLPELAASAETWRQGWELADLPYFFSRPAKLATELELLIVHSQPGALAGAMLVTRYGGLLRPLRLYSTVNRTGRRTVFGAPGDRLEIAAAAALFLLDRGACYINVDVATGLPEMDDNLGWKQTRAIVALRMKALAAGTHIPCEWTLGRKQRQFELPLGTAYEAAIARMNKRSRKNIKQTRGYAVRDLGVEFVANAKLSLDELQDLNEAAKYGVGAETARWRHGSTERFANVFLSGLKDRDGRWLAVAGARRNGSEVELDWQMNREDYTRYSLSMVLRGFLIEDEIARGTKTLLIEGATRQGISSAFEVRHVANLALRRRSWWLPPLEHVLRRLFPMRARNLFRARRQWTTMR
jgi:hypothetical protein